MASPPLVVAGAGSGGEASSGSEETGTAALPGRDLAALFEQAAERLPALLPAASKEQLLYLYARYKQVKFGTCNTPKPSFFDFEGKQKWEAWKALGDISPHQAMQEYIATVKKLDPSWNPQAGVSEHALVSRHRHAPVPLHTPACCSEQRSPSSFVLTKKVFVNQKRRSAIRSLAGWEEDKNIFDYCRENNIDYVTKAIRSKKVDVNVTDEETSIVVLSARTLIIKWHMDVISASIDSHCQKSHSNSRAGLCSTGRATEDTRSWFQYCYSTLLTLTARDTPVMQTSYLKFSEGTIDVLSTERNNRISIRSWVIHSYVCY
ncbi:acyl-CoA-binding domain-containing protein 6 isoform 5-T5 [Alca torda]